MGREGKQVAEQLMSATNVQARLPEANVFTKGKKS
jgi:hypothetical protein